MIELIIKQYLDGKDIAPCFFERTGLDSYLIIQKTGSSRDGLLDIASIVIQSYAPTIYDASLLNERVKEAMDSMAELDSISSTELNSDSYFPDLVTNKPRYQAYYQIYY